MQGAGTYTWMEPDAFRAFPACDASLGNNRPPPNSREIIPAQRKASKLAGRGAIVGSDGTMAGADVAG